MPERDSNGRFVSGGGSGGDRKSIELSAEARQILSDLETMPDWMLQAVARAMKLENQFTVGHIQQNYLQFSRDSAPVEIGLRKLSGRLFDAAWESDPVIQDQTVVSAIGDSVEYAEYQEFGTRGPYEIKPKNPNGVLAFQMGDRLGFAKRVMHPGLPARAPFQRGINDRLTDYSEAMSEAVAQSWEGQKQ